MQRKKLLENVGVSTDRSQDEAGDRRSFLKRAGITLGVVPLASANLFQPAVAEVVGEEISIETTEVKGRKRRQVVEEARGTTAYEDVRSELGSTGRPIEVIAYTVETDGDSHEGYRVTFGRLPDGAERTDSERSAIYVYLTDSGAKALGRQDFEVGTRTVSSEDTEMFDFGTSEARAALEHALAERAKMPAEVTTEELNPEEAILVHPKSGINAGGILFVPIQRDGEIVDRLTVQLTDPLSTPTVKRADTEDTVRIMSHRRCDPTGNVCTNYCTILCGALAGLSGAGCLAKCSSTIAGIPISPGCAGICAAVVGGTCRETCRAQTGH